MDSARTWPTAGSRGPRCYVPTADLHRLLAAALDVVCIDSEESSGTDNKTSLNESATASSIAPLGASSSAVIDTPVDVVNACTSPSRLQHFPQEILAKILVHAVDACFYAEFDPDPVPERKGMKPPPRPFFALPLSFPRAQCKCTRATINSLYCLAKAHNTGLQVGCLPSPRSVRHGYLP